MIKSRLPHMLYKKAKNWVFLKKDKNFLETFWDGLTIPNYLMDFAK